MEENNKSLENKEKEYTGYKVKLLDPRPNADNSKIFDGNTVYGIEVTIPELAEKCVFNLDPQHSGGDITKSAIEESLQVELPAERDILTTIRTDLDSFGAMAVFNLRKERQEITQEAKERISKISESDKFSKGDWPGVKPLPTSENMWPDGKSELSAPAAMVMDFKVTPELRVGRLQDWIKDGTEIKDYQTKVDQERLDMVRALENGGIKVEVKDGIALVNSKHRAGMEVGYRKAPIVLAENPEFIFRDAPAGLKYTIAQYNKGFIDLEKVLADIRTLEPGWGGSPTIIGSPQGGPSKLTTEQIFNILEKYKLNDNE